MSEEVNIVTLLKAHAGLAALVGSRIAIDRAEPEWAAPFVVIAREATANLQTLNDEIDNPDVSFDLRCWAASRTQADTVADQVSAALRTAKQVITDRQGGYSDEISMHCTVLKVLWSD